MGKGLERGGARSSEVPKLIPSRTPPQGPTAHAPPLGAHAHLARRGLRKFPFTRPLRQAPVSPSFSFSLVPAGRIPRMNSLFTKLLRVPEPSATYLSGFGTFPSSPTPSASAGRPRRQRRGRRRARARVMVGVAGAEWRGDALPERTSVSFSSKPRCVCSSKGVPFSCVGILGFYDSGLQLPPDLAGLLSSPSPDHQEAGINWVFPLLSSFVAQGWVAKADEVCRL